MFFCQLVVVLAAAACDSVRGIRVFAVYLSMYTTTTTHRLCRSGSAAGIVFGILCPTGMLLKFFWVSVNSLGVFPPGMDCLCPLIGQCFPFAFFLRGDGRFVPTGLENPPVNLTEQLLHDFQWLVVVVYDP